MAVHQAMGIALLPLALLLLEDRRDVRFVLSRVAPFACLSAVFLAIQRLGYRNPFVGEEAYAFGGHILVNFAKYLFGLATDAHTSAFRHISFGAVITAPGAALVTAVLVLAMLRGGVASEDIGLIGRASTLSAQAHQCILYKPQLDMVVELANAVGAPGVCVAHSGTLIGVLLPTQGAADTAAYILSRLPGEPMHCLHSLVQGGPRSIQQVSPCPGV